MKRLLSVLLVVMIIGCGMSLAEESGKASDSIMKNLKILDAFYQTFPEKFEAFYVMEAYTLFELYYGMKTLDTTESFRKIAQYGDSDTMVDAAKMLLKIDEDIQKEPRETFYKWLNGEITEENCRDVIMNYVDIIIQSYDEANKEEE